MRKNAYAGTTGRENTKNMLRLTVAVSEWIRGLAMAEFATGAPPDDAETF